VVDLHRSRRAVAAAFATQGMLLLSLTTRLPQLQHRWHVDDVTLSLLLLGMILLAGAGSVTAETLARRRDSALMLRGGLLVVAAGVAVLCVAPVLGVFVAGVAAYGFGLGLVDAATNMQAVALEHRYGRPILPSFHGAWTLGGVVGAALTLATSGVPVPAVAALAVVPVAVSAGRFLRRDHGPADAGPAGPAGPDGHPAAAVAVPWRPILLVGIGMVCFYMVDTAVQTWGPLFLDHTFPTPSRYVALAALCYLLASGAVRLAGDGLVARFGPVTVLRTGAVVGAAALALVVFSPSWPLAVLGFAVLGAGVAVVAPLSFSAAARIAGGDDPTGSDPAALVAARVARQARVDAVIARFNQFNYVGALLGSVLTGLVGADSLRVGFAVPMVLVLAIVPLAPAFAGRPVRR
jgi:MFS family permease